jgi:hypothetical protein
MKVFGIVLLIAGAISFFIGFSLDTTVASGFGGQRFHNIGLMNDRQNIIILAGVLAVIGAIFIGFGSRNQGSRATNTGCRTCPFCAEAIKDKAIICRFCKKELPPIPMHEATPYITTPEDISAADPDLEFCFHCGEPIKGNVKRCSSCGGALG